MKMNRLYTLLLAATIAFVMGCQTTGGWRSKIAGTYKGVISNSGSGDEYPSKTTVKVDAEKVSGVFELDVGGTEYTGTLSKFTLIGERQFKCKWLNNVDNGGNLSMTFAPDGSSFKGQWDGNDGEGGDGEWNGKK